MPERILALSKDVSSLVTSKVAEISRVTRSTKILALNAAVEAARAGAAGKSFAIVADEVGRVSESIRGITENLTQDLDERVSQLDNLGRQMVANVRGRRLSDLALNMIDIIDRNLYERSCDVRWWATDPAMVQCVVDPTQDNINFASKRLAVILASYTVYLDLWVLDTNGKVLANGRPDRYRVKGSNHKNQAWFRDAMATHDGTCFAVADVVANAELDNKAVATYATAIREGGEEHGAVKGVLGIFFDWEPQAQAVVDGVRLDPEEVSRTRCLLLDSKHRVIASSDGKGLLQETVSLSDVKEPKGTFVDKTGRMIGYALTPGYETYKGLGWYGVIQQDAPKG